MIVLHPTRIVMIPCRNEAATIGDLVARAKSHADIVVVADDGSMDRTAELATQAGARVVTVPGSRPGIAGVYAYGLRHILERCGESAHIAEMDAGGSHDPAALPAFWQALEAGADVAAGCRFGGDGASYQGHWQRKALSYGGTVLTRWLHATQLRDATSGFIAYRGEALARLLETPWKARGHYFQTELRLRALRLGMRVGEVPIVYRSSGSTLNWKSIREALQLVRER